MVSKNECELAGRDASWQEGISSGAIRPFIDEKRAAGKSDRYLVSSRRWRFSQ